MAGKYDFLMQTTGLVILILFLWTIFKWSYLLTCANFLLNISKLPLEKVLNRLLICIWILILYFLPLSFSQCDDIQIPSDVFLTAVQISDSISELQYTNDLLIEEIAILVS